MKASKQDITNAELLAFVKDAVPTKEDLKSVEMFVNTIERRMSNLETRALSLEGRTAEQILNSNKKFTEIISNQAAHSDVLEGIVTQLKILSEEKAAEDSALRRLNHRDQAFAKALKLKLADIDGAG